LSNQYSRWDGNERFVFWGSKKYLFVIAVVAAKSIESEPPIYSHRFIAPIDSSIGHARLSLDFFGMESSMIKDKSAVGYSMHGQLSLA
jgi:hypothetical protein